VIGQGNNGIIAAYAALFEPSIKEVVVIDPPKSHKEGPYFLIVLRVLDIPDLLGLLAPTPLTIIGGNDPAFDRTAEIYRLAGAADKLKRKNDTGLRIWVVGQLCVESALTRKKKPAFLASQKTQARYVP